MAITVNSVAMIHVHSRWLNHVESTSQPHQQNLIGRIHSKTAQYFLSNQAEPRKASLVLPCWSTHRLHSETWDPQKGCMSSIPNSYKVSFKYIAIFTYMYIICMYEHFTRCNYICTKLLFRLMMMMMMMMFCVETRRFSVTSHYHTTGSYLDHDHSISELKMGNVHLDISM